jgi:hypothetical protein
MTKKLLFILTVTFAFSAKAQNIPNAGFESWTPGFGYDDPNSWGTLNAASILGMPISVTKSTERHGGAFSAKVETMSTIDSTGQETPSPGFMFIGSVNILQQTGVFGTSFTARPDSLVGWVKCNSVNGDTSGIALQLTKWDAIALTQEQLGFGSFITTSTSTSFYRFSVPIEYVSENTPDSLSVIVISSLGAGQIGSAIWVDDLYLIYNTSSSVGELNGTSFDVFPNPVNDELSISSKTVDKMEVYSTTGILIDHIVIDAGLIYTYDTKKLANGLYLVKNSKGELKRFIVQH